MYHVKGHDLDLKLLKPVNKPDDGQYLRAETGCFIII
jgi:hypothetical protein